MRRHIRFAAAALAGLSAAAASVALVPSATATSGPYTPEAVPRGCEVSGAFEVCTLDPTQSGGQDNAIEERLTQYTAEAGDGDSIRVAMYSWTRREVADALVAASDRGADVKIVIDDIIKQSNTEAYKVLSASDIPLTSCVDSCLGTGINHNKFFLFDVGGAVSAAQTSSNMTSTQQTKYNNMLTVTGDTGLYDWYTGYWNRLNAKSWTYDGVTWGDADKIYRGDGVEAYAYPRGSDNLLGILNNITECGDDHGTIRVAQSMFREKRVAIRDRLAELQDSLGCDVQVITSSEGTDEQWVEAGGLDPAKVVSLESHNKLIIVDAFMSDRSQQAVFTGSHNLTGTSLSNNDEAIVKVENDAFVFGAFTAYFDGMYDRAGGA
ncbi:MAG: phospholipase D-like domain-containing protein [Stackebrandtia sp.]